MTLLNWIKSKDRTSPVVLSQINGLTVLCLLAIAVYFVAFFSSRHPDQVSTLPGTDPFAGAVAVEVSGETKRRGIYYQLPNTTLAHFLRSADIPHTYLPPHLTEKVLQSGMNIVVGEAGEIRLGDMPSATRLALNIPLDINQAKLEDLILIPGIKEATAEKILSFRKSAGGRIKHMDDLLRISGIKEKRLRHMQKYLRVTP